MNAVYWIAHILLCRYNEREGEHAGGGDAVVQTEHPAVNMNVGNVEQTTQLTEYLKHLALVDQLNCCRNLRETKSLKNLS